MGTVFSGGLGTSFTQRVHLRGQKFARVVSHVCGTAFARECELGMEYGKNDESQEWMEKNQKENFERTERFIAEDDFTCNDREVC